MLAVFLADLFADLELFGVVARLGVAERLGVLPDFLAGEARFGEAERFRDGERDFLEELPPAAIARRVGVLLRPRLGDGLALRCFLVDVLRLLERLRDTDRPRLEDFLREEEAEDPAKQANIQIWQRMRGTSDGQGPVSIVYGTISEAPNGSSLNGRQ